MKYHTKKDAIHEILWQAARDRLSFTGYKNAVNAFKTLELGDEATKHAMCILGYYNLDTGEPNEWIKKKLAGLK